MARIAKSEYPKIQQMASVEGRKVPEIADLYGCTPANIYAILSKLRRQGEVVSSPPLTASDQPSEQEQGSELPVPSQGISDPAIEGEMAGDLLAALEQEAARPAQPPAGDAPAKERDAPELAGRTAGAPPALVQVQPEAGIPKARPAQELPVAPVSVGKSRTPLSLAAAKATTASKPGFALCMRTSDGDESSTPFRSLDDLLSAVKPILRSAARSSDPIWFCIQPMDLADIDSEAA